MRLVCFPTWPICPKICQTAVPRQHLSLLFSSKESLQDASFLQILLKTEAWWDNAPAKTQFVCTGLCQHYQPRIPSPHLCGRGFVRGPQLAAAAVRPVCSCSPSPSPRLAPQCCCHGWSPESQGAAGGTWLRGCGCLGACRWSWRLLDVGHWQPNRQFIFSTSSSSRCHHHEVLSI